MEEIEVKKDAWEIRRIALALGLWIPSSPLALLNEDETCMLFFKQHCSNSRERTQEAIQAWERMSDMERRVAYLLNLRADWVLQWDQAPNQAWTMAMNDKDLDVIRILSTVGEDLDQPETAFQLAQQITKMILEEREKFPRVIMNTSPAHPDYTKGQFELRQGLREFAPQARQVLANHIIAWAIPEWPEPAPLGTRARLMTIFSLMHAEVAPPQWLFEEIDSTEVPVVLDELVNMLGSFEGSIELGREGNAIGQETMDCLALALSSKATAEDLLRHEALILRMCILYCSEEALKHVLEGFFNKEGFQRALKKASAVIQDRFPSNNQFGMPMAQALGALDTLDRIHMQVHLENDLPEAEGQARRPGMRL